jgi:hypothetical protein|tara:strand:+ start:6856 stop:7536 length:681 start_codon:yes stop_codon:yes gene_type:complete
MSDKTDEEERDAQKKVGDELDKAYDEAEALDGNDLADAAKARIGSDGLKAKVDKATAEAEGEAIQDELDEIKEELSRAEYKKANRRRRKLARKIKARLKVGAGTRGQKILDALKAIRKTKLKELWRPAPLAAKQVSDEEGSFVLLDEEPFKVLCAPGLADQIALRASLDAAYEDAGDAIAFLPLSAVSGISQSDAELLQETLGISKVGDLSQHRVLQRLLYLNSRC